ncbi:MAG: histidine kinase [Actinomycetota bacterium]
MSESPTLAFWAGDRQYWIAFVAACVGAVVALGEGGFRPLDWSLLPFVPLGFFVKAQWPATPNAVFAVPALIVPLVVNMTDTTVEFAMFLMVIAVVLLAKIEVDERISNGYVIIGVVTVAVLGITGVYVWAWINWSSALVLSWAFGTAVKRYEKVLAELRATQAEVVDQATLVERRRIARDVHDLIGHSLSVVMLHIGGARRLIRTDPDEAEAALLQAEEAGRASMMEVRRTVGLMRDHDDSEGTAPAPTLADIATVVEQYRTAGMAIDYQTFGDIHAVEGPVAVACHRIAQEALANTAKHTVEASVAVQLVVDAESCRLTLNDRNGRAVVADDRLPGTGHGLIGMRERALSAGGSLFAGPIDGGWSVDAVFPLDRNQAVR